MGFLHPTDGPRFCERTKNNQNICEQCCHSEKLPINLDRLKEIFKKKFFKLTKNKNKLFKILSSVRTFLFQLDR